MPKKRFNDERLAFALKRAEVDAAIGEICRKRSVEEATFHRWRVIDAGMDVSEIRRLKQLGTSDIQLPDRSTTRLVRPANQFRVPPLKPIARAATKTRAAQPGRS